MKNDPNQDVFREMGELARLVANQTDSQKKLFADDVYRNRYRNFFTLPLFFAVIIFFLYLGSRYRASFSNFSWYILLGLVGFFLLLGFFVWISYAVLIIKNLGKGRKKE